MSRGLVVLSLSCLAFVACGGSPILGPTPTPDPCSPSEITQYIETIEDVAVRFDDAVTLANSTPRMSLPPVIADLQSIRRDAQNLEVPECAEAAQSALVRYMNGIISAFTIFLGDGSDSEIEQAFRTARSAFNSYERQIDEMNEAASEAE